MLTLKDMAMEILEHLSTWQLSFSEAMKEALKKRFGHQHPDAEGSRPEDTIRKIL